MNLTELKYPIGKFKMPEVITPVLLQDYILIINAFPEKLQSAVINLTTQQLDTPYREGGWTVRQLVHHCADSHMN
ncbi:MAG TPA: metal-dependent hydrolase, partial [Cyclobacteriaceae bacterium]|nr:metal-dependent hydrolase [Cyclobacteriaceae bacterium]